MQLTKQEKLAVDVMALAAKGDGKVTTIEVQRHTGVGFTAAFTVLTELKQAGLLTSKIGRGGGFSLACPAKELRLAQIVARLRDGQDGSCNVPGRATLQSFAGTA